MNHNNMDKDGLTLITNLKPIRKQINFITEIFYWIIT